MPYYRVKFPDPGAARTRTHCFVEGRNKDDVRQLAAEHEHFDNWNTDGGTVSPTEIRGRKELEQRVMNVTDPNTAVLADGTLMRRDLENGGVYEQQPA